MVVRAHVERRHAEAALVAGAGELTVTLDGQYPYARVYAPPRARFVCVEPMTAPVDALRTGAMPVVEPSSSFTATSSMGVQ